MNFRTNNNVLSTGEVNWIHSQTKNLTNMWSLLNKIETPGLPWSRTSC